MSAPPLGLLAGWRGRLSTPAGQWRGGERDADGTIQMPWFEPGDAMTAFVTDAYESGWVGVRDWPDWLAQSDNRAFSQNPDAIRARATPGDLAAILTAHIRGDRFSEGHLAAMIEAGVIEAILDRAAVLDAGG